jgi:oligo-1,6-glucosidase
VEVSGVSPETVLPAIRRMGRDNARTPMQWTGERHGGFTDGTPWIGVNPNHRTINAASQYGDTRSVLEFYRALIGLRHAEPVVANGDFRMLAAEHPTLFAFQRCDQTSALTVIANFSDRALSLEVVADIGAIEVPHARLVLANYPATSRPLRDSLGPWEVRVVLAKPLTGDRRLARTTLRR